MTSHFETNSQPSEDVTSFWKLYVLSVISPSLYVTDPKYTVDYSSSSRIVFINVALDKKNHSIVDKKKSLYVLQVLSYKQTLR